MPKCNKCGVCCGKFSIHPNYSLKEINKIFVFEALLYCWGSKRILSKSKTPALGTQRGVEDRRNKFKTKYGSYDEKDITIVRLMLKPKLYNKKHKIYFYSCNFLHQNKCLIYKYRPSFCKDYGTKYPASHKGCSMISK